MADAAYNGIFGFGFSCIFTPSTGTAFGSQQAQIEEATTPPVTIDIAKFTPISGANSNIEQFALGRYPVQEYKMKVTYSAAEHLAELEVSKQRDLVEKGKTSAKDIRKAAGKTEKISVKQVKDELDSVIADYATVKGVPKELLDVLQSLRDRL